VDVENRLVCPDTAALDAPGPGVRLLVWALILLAACTTCAHAASYYISPTGSDSANGTAASTPWKTFAKAIAALGPGDTLLLLDGTYSKADSGNPYMNCGSGTASGTASQPITFKAQNERKALIQGAGNNVVQLDNCSYWVIEGIYSRNVDIEVSGYEGSTFVANGGAHLTFRRNLAYSPNAWFNSHGFGLYNTHHALVEENEVYYVTRHAFVLGDSNNPNDGTVMRRNYAHSRDHDSMPGGYTCAGSCENHRGDEGISCYPCKNSIIENNVMEDFGTNYTIQGKYQPFNNKYFGNISLSGGGFGFGARGERVPNSPDQMPTDTVLTDNVAVKVDSWASFNCRVCKNTQYRNNSAIDNIAPTSAAPMGVNWDRSCGTSCGEGGDGNLSDYATNTLLVNQQGPAWQVVNVPQWAVDYLWVHLVGEASPPMSDSHYTHVTMRDPGLGSCIVYLPPGSPARGAGAEGADIGASIVYRYQDGQLTTQPLWDTQTGKFPCGAIVPGVNDVVGKSCTNVHERLHVGTSGCALPYQPAGHGALLTWQAPASGGQPAVYQVWRKAGEDAPALLVTIPATQLTYTDTGASPGVCYTVIAKNSAGEATAPPVCATAPVEPPQPVEDLTVAPAVRSNR